MSDYVKFQKTETSTPPTGTMVAADVIDGVAYQRVKIVVGEDGVVEDFAQTSDIPLLELKTLGVEILTQLKIMNLYFSDITGNTFTEEDV